MAAENVWEEVPRRFEPLCIDGIPMLTPEVIEKLSTDAKYLHQLCNLVNFGVDSQNSDFLFNKIGPLCHSRWLTLASRVLRIYVSMETDHNLYGNIKLLAKYVVGVYWKTHIQAKYKNTIMDGPNILFQEIQVQKKLFSGNVNLKILQASVQHNCYFAHPENVLLAMLGDDDKTVRAKAVKMILKIRRTAESTDHTSSIRKFHLPKCNFEAKSYPELVTIYDSGRTSISYLSNKKGILPMNEPPLIKACTDVKQFIEQPLQLNYPNHTQSVERGVKLTTEATGRIAGQKRQIGEALCTVAGRKKRWIGKKHYVTRKAMNQCS